MTSTNQSQELTGGALAQIDDGADEVDRGGQDEDRKPASVRLRDELGRQRAARDARDRRLTNTDRFTSVTLLHGTY